MIGKKSVWNQLISNLIVSLSSEFRINILN